MGALRAFPSRQGIREEQQIRPRVGGDVDVEGVLDSGEEGTLGFAQLAGSLAEAVDEGQRDACRHGRCPFAMRGKDGGESPAIYSRVNPISKRGQLARARDERRARAARYTSLIVRGAHAGL
jgi:hypothetical protein